MNALKDNKFLYIIAFGAMFMMGYVDGMRGPLIPYIRSTFGVNYSSIGVMLLMANLGYLIASFLGGIFCDKVGQKKVAVFGFICVFSGILGIYLSFSFGLFLFMMALLNIGMGSIEMSTNSLISIIVLKKQALIMSLLHFFYGAGASIGPRYSGLLLSINIEWQRIYFYSLVLVALLLIYLIVVRYPQGRSSGHRNKLPFSSIIGDRKVLLFGAFIGFYYSTELGVANWLVNYLNVIHNMEELESSFYLSLFFGLFTLGRLFGGFVVEKIGYVNSIISFMVVSMLLFGGGIILGRQYVFLISFCGLSFSIVFPTTVTVILNEFKVSTSSVLGFIITMGSAISMASNWLIGKLNDLLGVRAGFNSILGFVLIVVILSLSLKVVVENAKERVHEADNIQL